MGPITPPVNSAKFEESTEIILDTEVEIGATGWAINYCSVNRVGNLVAVHLEATNDADADPLVTTLQSEFAPGALVTTPDGDFAIGADGTVSFTAATTLSALRVCQAVFQAGSTSP